MTLANPRLQTQVFEQRYLLPAPEIPLCDTNTALQIKGSLSAVFSAAAETDGCPVRVTGTSVPFTERSEDEGTWWHLL